MSQAMLLNQLAQLENPDGRIALTAQGGEATLEDFSHGVHGLGTKDSPRWIRQFLEVANLGKDWDRLQTTTEDTQSFAGAEQIVLWQQGQGELCRLGRDGWAVLAGGMAWGKCGVLVTQMRQLPCSIATGDKFDKNAAVVLPKDPAHLAAIWCFCSSPEFNRTVRTIDQSLKVTNATLVKVPFNLDHWQQVAQERYPDGLPEPHSDDPTQWLFRGDIPSSAQPLHVAIARLLGYRWPDQTPDSLDACIDEDGIITLSPLVGQEGFASRLRSILQAAYQIEAPERPNGAPKVEEPRRWDESNLPRLLARAGSPGMNLEEWLRDKFFESHCKLFHQRPFIWHIWDGRKDGFHAFVNYHKLDRKNLERLTHVYLGEWIERQKSASDSGDKTADARLVAAQELQRKLELIRLGEPPYDIFVRWKSLDEQPMGWDPDLNDGVRMNIRPFVEAGILRGKVNVNWNKDRGKDPKPNISGTVERHNDLHFTLAEKRAAKESQKGGAG